MAFAMVMHGTKVVSSIEPRQLKRDVTTEFQWEVRSLTEQLAVSPYGIQSPIFDLHGTEAEDPTFSSFGIVSTAKGHARVKQEDAQFTFNLSAIENYIFSVKAWLSCDGEELRSEQMMTNGRDSFNNGNLRLFSVARCDKLGSKIQEQNGFSLTIQITTVSTVGGQIVETTMDTSRKVEPQLSLSSNLQSALNAGEFSDVTLKSEEGDSFPAHRQLLAMRSPVFRAMFYGSMIEAQSGIANIKASSAAVRQLLKCIYTDEIDAVEDICLELLELGVQYEVPRLAALIREQLLLTLSVDNVVERFLLAIRHSNEELQKACEAIVVRNLSTVMKTQGWAQIAANPEAMAIVIKGGRRPRDDNDLSPRKLKRLRFGGPIKI